MRNNDCIKRLYGVLAVALMVVCGCNSRNEVNCDGNGLLAVVNGSDTTAIVVDKVSVGGVAFQMIGVDGGVFKMGYDGKGSNYRERPVHCVQVSSFSIGETEVTQALWKAVMNENPSDFKGDMLPVENVSWNDCKEFISRLNGLTGLEFRLPTEAEWEYAARGGNRSKGYLYSGGDEVDSVGWYIDNSGSTTHIVKSKRPNELGLYDMTGNVMEWCNDWFVDSYDDDYQVDPKGPEKGTEKAKRGGSWYYYGHNTRVSNRNLGVPEDKSSHIGLRLALAGNSKKTE